MKQCCCCGFEAAHQRKTRWFCSLCYFGGCDPGTEVKKFNSSLNDSPALGYDTKTNEILIKQDGTYAINGKVKSFKKGDRVKVK